MQLSDPALFKQHAFINGIWLSAASQKSLDVTNPATGERLGQVPDMDENDTLLAVEAARLALIGWRALPAQRRAALLRDWFELMLAHSKDLAMIMTLEQESRWPKRKARSATPPRLLSGLRSRPSARMAKSSPLRHRIVGSWS